MLLQRGTVTMFPSRWPPELCQYLRATFGDAVAVTRLYGVGGAGAYRLTAVTGRAIVKGPAQQREVHFYERVAPGLRPQGVPVPALYWSGAGGWLVLEEIPRPLPRSRWHGDPQVLTALCSLHQSTWGQALAGPEPFLPRWDGLMTDAALSCLPAETARQLRAPLLHLAESAQGLFDQRCCLSGDPNPTNWGTRSDGSAVLFDWERFGYGTPELDLAISLPGLGSLDGEAERQLADQYTALCRTRYGPPGDTTTALGAAIRRGKVWAAVEFLSNDAQGLLPDHARANARRIAELLPPVVVAVASEV
jgi:hypothetical protein